MLPLVTDLSRALRSLRSAPALVAVAVSSMALGIGVNVTIYSVVREMVLDDLSARQPDRLARVTAEIPYARYRELRQAGVFQDLAFNVWLNDINWNSGTHGETAWQMITSANFFDVLGVGASAGRLYSQADEGRPVAVVSYGFWRGRLGSDTHIAGRSLNLDPQPSRRANSSPDNVNPLIPCSSSAFTCFGFRRALQPPPERT